MKPAIAIIIPNTLAGIGLSDIIRRMMPNAGIVFFSRYADLAANEEKDSFFHYFVSAQEVMSGASFFLQRQHKTIVLVHGDEGRLLPEGFHLLNVLQSEADLVYSIWSMAKRSHGRHGAPPAVVQEAQQGPEGRCCGGKPKLTPRECEVLKGVVSGLINKEIAEKMGVSLATVITHRKNLTEKLGTRSVSALTIYAVSHGIIRSDEI